MMASRDAIEPGRALALADFSPPSLGAGERLIRLAVMVPDSPGSLARLTRLIADAQGNVVEVTHKRAFSEGSVRDAIVDFVIETRDARHAAQLEATLAAAGFRLIDTLRREGRQSFTAMR